MDTNTNKECNTGALITLATIAGGAGIIFAIGMVIQAVTAPLTNQLQALVSGQKKIEKVLVRIEKNNMNELQERLKSLEAEVKALKARPAPVAQAPQMPPAEDMNTVYNIPVADSYVLGPKDAPVTITVFQDYQCPFCARFFPAAAEGQKAFPDKVRIVVKHFPLPFHNMARPAAKAAMAAGEQGKFYEMSDLIMNNAAALSEDKFKELAGKAGLNVPKFLKDLKDKDAVYEKRIEADMQLGGRSDVRGTPTYFLNGKKSDARMPDQWKAEIGALLKK